MKTRWIATIAVLALALAACGSNGDDEGTGNGPRTIEITAHDELRFEPADVEVSAGESVRFVVTNVGSTVHDFYIGTEQEQMAHEAEMGGMDHDTDPAEDALTVDAGETDELTVTFDEPGELLYGCHQPGHYEGGMVGTITVT